MEKEIWKDVIGWENDYMISNLGNLLSLPYSHKSKNQFCEFTRKVNTRKIVKPFTNMHGYVMHTLSRNGRRKNINLHRLVATAFIPNPENKPCVNHKNGIRADNRIENLEWCTFSENTIHAVKNNLTPNVGATHYKTKLTKENVLDIRSSSLSMNELARKYSVVHSTIQHILSRKNWASV